MEAAAGQLPHPHQRRRSTGGEVEARGRVLEESLASHGVETRLVGMTVGPTVTRYELELGAGREGRPGHEPATRTSPTRWPPPTCASWRRSRAARPSASRCPTTPASSSALGDILASPEAKTATHPLEVAIGKDIAGRSVILNLATTPHLLIAGATGAGKSSGINCSSRRS